jgi:hypothetical protein
MKDKEKKVYYIDLRPASQSLGTSRPAQPACTAFAACLPARQLTMCVLMAAGAVEGTASE